MNRLLLILIIILLVPITTHAKIIDPETRIIISSNDKHNYGAINRTSYGGITVLEFNSKEETREVYKEIVKIYPDAFIDKPVYLTGVTSSKISGASDIGVINAKKYNNFGNKKVTVAIIDTGLTPIHPIFNGRKISDKSINLVTNSKSFEDKIDHGTPIAGIITACTSKNVELMPINIFDDNYQSTVSLLILGLNYAIDNGADAINLSITTRDGYIPKLDEVLKKAYDRNILVFASTGNNFKNQVQYPASSKYTISVGSYDAEHKTRSYVGNYGEGLDFVCPGDFVRSVNNKGGTEKYIGTSFSVPYMVACGAWLKLVDRDITVKQAYKAFKAKAKDRGKKGWDKCNGWGSPRINYSINYIFRKQFRAMKNFKKLPRNFNVKYSKRYAKVYRKKDDYLFIKRRIRK